MDAEAITHIVLSIITTGVPFYLLFAALIFTFDAVVWATFVHYVYPELIGSDALSRLIGPLDFFVPMILTTVVATQMINYTAKVEELCKISNQFRTWVEEMIMVEDPKNPELQQILSR